MQKYLICCGAFLTIFVSSCSNTEPAAAIASPASDDEPFLEEGTSVETNAREPVFVYNQQSVSLGDAVKLSLNGEPLLVDSRYVRLVGVVSGGNPVALLEIAGRGLALGLGEEVLGYELRTIGRKEIKLIKKEN